MQIFRRTEVHVEEPRSLLPSTGDRRKEASQETRIAVFRGEGEALV